MKKFNAIVAAILLSGVSLLATDGASLYKACASCHGAKAEKKYIGKVPALSSLSNEERVNALKEYKDGKRNIFGMGAVMKAQASKLDDASIKAISDYIDTLK